MKLIFKLGIIFSLSTFLIFSSCDKDENYTIPSNNRPPPPPQTTQNEIILDSLVWNYWLDQNDPSCFDEIYLYIPDTSKILSSTPLRIFVRPDSSITWLLVNELTNGNCTPSYYYYISHIPGMTDIPGKSILFIEHCPLNYNLIGTRASVKIVY